MYMSISNPMKMIIFMRKMSFKASIFSRLDRIGLPIRAIVIILLISGCFSCNSTPEQNAGNEAKGSPSEMKFDQAKWQIKEGYHYPYRDQMVDDLLYTDRLRVLEKDEIIDLLGKPNRTDSLFLFYTISQKRLFFFPLHTKTMVIKLSDDNTVDWIKLHE